MPHKSQVGELGDLEDFEEEHAGELFGDDDDFLMGETNSLQLDYGLSQLIPHATTTSTTTHKEGKDESEDGEDVLEDEEIDLEVLEKAERDVLSLRRDEREEKAPLSTTTTSMPYGQSYSKFAQKYMVK